MKKKNPLVSIVITTKNEEAVLGTLLKSIKDQTYPNIETILVDNYSTDDTVKIANKYNLAIYEFGPERSAQRNFGAKKSTGDFLFSLDADIAKTQKYLGWKPEVGLEKGLSS